jgi:hypothetical protein
MADNQMVKIVFDFDLGNVPASAKKLSQYLKDNSLDLKFTKASVDGLSASLGQLSTQQTKAGNAAAAAGNQLKKSNMQWTNLALVIQDLPYGFRGIQNNLPALMGGFAGMTGPIYLAGSALIAFFTAWDNGFFKSKTSADKLKEKTKELRDEIIKSTQSAREQGITLLAYVAIARDVTQSENTRNEALERANEIYGRHNEKLTLANINTERVKKSLDGYIESLIQLAVAEKYAGQIADNIIEQGLIQADIDEANIKRQKLLEEIRGKQTNKSRDLVDVYDDYYVVLDEIKSLEDAKSISMANGTKTIELHSAAMKKAVLLAGKYGRVPKAESNKQEISDREKALATIAENERKAALELYNERDRELRQITSKYREQIDLATKYGQETIVLEEAWRAELAAVRKKWDDKEAKDAQEIADKIAKIQLDTKFDLASAIAKINSDFANENIKNVNAELSSTLKATKNNYQAQASAIGLAISKLTEYRDIAKEAGWSTTEFDDAIKNLGFSLEGLVDPIENFNTQLTNIINNTLSQLGASIGESIASSLLGTSGLQGALDMFLSVLAGGLIQVGELAIATGVAILGIKKALETLNPYVAIAAGIALIALGSFVRGSLQKKSEGLGGTKKFANGGIISGPTMGLMGEYPGAKTNPEVVAPLDKLKSMMGGGAGSGEFVLRGNDLVLAMQRSNSSLKLRRG